MQPEQRGSVALRVVENAEAAANHRVRPQLIGESESRRQVVPVVLDANLAVGVDSRQQQFSGLQVEIRPPVVTSTGGGVYS